MRKFLRNFGTVSINSEFGIFKKLEIKPVPANWIEKIHKRVCNEYSRDRKRKFQNWVPWHPASIYVARRYPEIRQVIPHSHLNFVIYRHGRMIFLYCLLKIQIYSIK